MSRYLNPRFESLEAYVPGEQPKGEYIKLNANESPYPPSPAVIEAIRGAEGSVLNMYPDAACRELGAALAASLGVEPDNILCANGSDDILNFCFMAYGQNGALFPRITYGFYEVFCALHGIVERRAPMHEGFTLCPEDYFNAGCLVVLANPNAQTGVEMPLAGVEEIVKNNPDSIVVVDEAYVAFGGTSALPLTKKYDNVLVVRTFSKSRSMAGARLGFAVGCAGLIADLRRLKYSTNPYSVNRSALAAGVAAVKDSTYYEANCAKIVETREKFSKELKNRCWQLTDSRANFVLARPPRGEAAGIAGALKERGILVRYLGGELADYLRITIGRPEQMEALLAALDELQ